MNLRPLHNQIVIKIAEKEEVSPGGIVIPDVAQKRSQFGDVLAVGEGGYVKGGGRRAPDVQVGDRVLIERRTYGSKFTSSEGEEVLVIHESNVLGVVEG